MTSNEIRGELFLRRLPPEIREELRPEQEAAIRAAAGRGRDSHPFDIRFELPTPWGRYYVALLAGPDRRTSGRLNEVLRRQALHRRPLMVAGNGLMRRAGATVLCLLLLGGLLLYGAALEF